MIIPMRKLSLLVYSGEYRQFLEELRERGVLHLCEDTKREGEDETLQSKLHFVKRLTDMIRLLQNRTVKESDGRAEVTEEELLPYLEELLHKQDQTAAQLAAAEKELTLYEPWGHFSTERVEKLAEVGWDMRFFTVPDRKFEPVWEDKFHATVINEDRGLKYFVTVTPAGETEKPDADVFTFPAETEEALRGKIKRLREEREQAAAHLDDITADSLARLQHYRECVSDAADFLRAEDAAAALVDDKVVALEGWLPSDREGEMRGFLQDKGVYYEFSSPTPDEDVPVLLKNSRFSKLFEPITEMFSLPNYHELDPTPFLAPFFMLFFGLCMGDGGYGLLIWAVCFLMMRKASEGMKGYLKLGEYLGMATVVVGILTGSFFGIALDAVEWSWLKGVKQYFLTDANYSSQLGGYNPMMVVAVALGIIQILYGMCIASAKITKQFGFRYAVSKVAWVAVLVLLGVTFGLPALGVAFSTVILYVLYVLMGICAVAIVFMNSPGKGIFTNVGSALWGTYNMATGLLGDVLSYIRLFALGLTGSILGGVFNTLAFDLTASLSFVPRFISVLLILLIGHAINFGLCIIAAFVHPMRLTFVEFYKNAEFEGGGKRYTPFRRRVADVKK